MYAYTLYGYADLFQHFVGWVFFWFVFATTLYWLIYLSFFQLGARESAFFDIAMILKRLGKEMYRYWLLGLVAIVVFFILTVVMKLNATDTDTSPKPIFSGSSNFVKRA